MMRRMLLSHETYRWLEPRLYEKKLREYQRAIKKGENQQQFSI